MGIHWWPGKSPQKGPVIHWWLVDLHTLHIVTIYLAGLEQSQASSGKVARKFEVIVWLVVSNTFPGDLMPTLIMNGASRAENTQYICCVVWWNQHTWDRFKLNTPVWICPLRNYRKTFGPSTFAKGVFILLRSQINILDHTWIIFFSTFNEWCLLSWHMVDNSQEMCWEKQNTYLQNVINKSW